MHYIIFFIIIIGLVEMFLEYWYITIPAAAVLMFLHLIKEKGEDRKSFLVTTNISVCILIVLILAYKKPQKDENENDKYINIYDRENEKEPIEKNDIEKESNEVIKSEEMKIERESVGIQDKYLKEEYSNFDNPFPKTEDYIVNNALIEYNKIAEYPINDEFMNGMKSVPRPLGKATITISNGVYFIIQYNDYNQILFIDYQEETDDDSGLFAVMRDLTKAINPKIEDNEIEELWENLKTGKYWNYYDNLYEISGFEFSLATRVVNIGQTQYSLKSKYYPYGKKY